MMLSASTARHLLLRYGRPARLPEALLGSLRDEVVLGGWMRASGVLEDVQIRAFDSRLGGLAPIRRISGPVQAVVIEGSIGLAAGDVSCGLRAVLARETESGLETIAGEIVDARIIALEAIVTALDDAAAARSLDAAGVWLLDLGGSSAPAPRAPSPPAAAPRVDPPSPQWAEAARASDPEPPKPAPARPSPTFSAGSAAVIPQRIMRPAVVEDDHAFYPDAGDTVEHFAFGRCEVIKSDGDRLHVRMAKDGRIKEISTDMLKMALLPPVEGATGRHFKLDRKL